MQRGMVRGLDNLGRIVIPIEFLKLIGLRYGSQCTKKIDGDVFIVSNKNTGISHIDELGRVVVPAIMRNNLNINPKDEMEIRCFDNFVAITLKGAKLPSNIEKNN